VTFLKSKNPDRWIEGISDFSRPICSFLREWIVRWEPDLTESVKWNALCFTGRKLVCGISGCKKHVSIIFFRGTELLDPNGLFTGGEDNSSIRNVRIKSCEEIRREPLRRLLHAAVELDLNPDIIPPSPRRRGPVEVPEILASALKGNKKAAAVFAGLAPTYQREYIYWINSAKRRETVQRRLSETMEALTRGNKWGDRKN